MAAGTVMAYFENPRLVQGKCELLVPLLLIHEQEELDTIDRSSLGTSLTLLHKGLRVVVLFIMMRLSWMMFVIWVVAVVRTLQNTLYMLYRTDSRTTMVAGNCFIAASSRSVFASNLQSPVLAACRGTVTCDV